MIRPGPSPRILAFDTSAAHVTAAYLSGDQIVAERHEHMQRGQAERLMPLLEQVLADASQTWQSLTAIGVGIGPGNFTGIRISVAAARGLALSLGIPAIGVSTLDAQAHGLPRPILSLVDARREHLYVQKITDRSAEPPRLMRTSDVEAMTGIARIGPGGGTAVAASIARIAAALVAAGGKIARPAPLYIRAADAAPPRDPAPVILP